MTWLRHVDCQWQFFQGNTTPSFGLGVLLNPWVLRSFSESVYGPLISVKRKFLDKFEFYNTIYTFNNYFIIVFLTNKRYLNTPLKTHLHLLKIGTLPNHIVTNLKPN